MAHELSENVPSPDSDIDELNDETFGSGAVDDDWEAAHCAKVAGEGKLGVAQPQTGSDGVGHRDVSPAAPSLNGEEVLPALSQLKIKDLWPTSPQQGTRSPHDSIWSSPELSRPTSHTPPRLPSGSKVLTVEELERELSSTPDPPPSSLTPPPPTPPNSVHPSLMMRGPPPPFLHYAPHMPHPPPQRMPWMGGRGLPPPPIHILPRHLLPRMQMPPTRAPPPGLPPHPYMPPPPRGILMPPHALPHPPHAHHPPPHLLSANRRSRRSEFLSEMRADGSGFMTQKEKDWVIHIQLIQLQSSDPANDDYYYQHYVQKKMCRGKKGAKEGEAVLTLPQISREERHYRPAEFKGTLGKLSVSSISAPRKMIEIPMSGGTEEVEEGGSTHTPSRDAYTKKRQTLMTIEKLYSAVLVLEAVERKALALPEEDRHTILGERDAACGEVARLLRLKSIDEVKKGDDQLFQQIMSYRKGKRVIKRLIPLLPEAHAQAVVMAMMRNLAVIIRKDTVDQVLPELVVGVRAVVFGARLPMVNRCLADFLVGGASHTSLSKVMHNKFGSSVLEVLVSRGCEVAMESQTQAETEGLQKWTEVTQQLYTSLVPLNSDTKSAILELLSGLPHLSEH